MELFGAALEIILVLLQWCTVLSNAAEPISATMPTKRPKSPKTTRDLYVKRTKPLYFEYYPNYGFEPYWADGEWVLSTTPNPNISSTQKDDTTTRKPEICGEECNYLFQRINHVCTRLSDEHEQPRHGCWGGHCSGWPGDNYDPGYKTFDTYCKFLDAQCRSRFYNPKRWVLVHVGKCKPLESYFQPLWDAAQPVSRMEFYLNSLGTMPTFTAI